MLSFLAIAYNASRLGFEAQNAAAFRLLRLANGLGKAAADSRAEQTTVAVQGPAEARVIRPERRAANKKINKKSTPVRKRGKRAK